LKTLAAPHWFVQFVRVCVCFFTPTYIIEPLYMVQKSKTESKMIEVISKAIICTPPQVTLCRNMKKAFWLTALQDLSAQL